MPRAPTTLDPFNAVAEPKRRLLLGALIAGERAVNDIVVLLKWPQPQVSKHLAVLLKVGLVRARSDGRQRLYQLNGEQLKPVHDWVKTFERFWEHQLTGIKARAEAKAKAFNDPARKAAVRKEKK